jgi:adenylosuccinate synthase
LRNTPDWPLFEDRAIIDRWIASISRVTEYDLVWPEEKLREWFCAEERVVFEGAQGMLLDAEAGFYPYTTWSDCSPKNALNMIHEMAPDSEIFTLGVLRSHMVRHGNGPLPTETSELNKSISDHNHYNEWQGPVRYGWFDAVLARYALKAAGKIDALAVTHMDSAARSSTWTYCDGYEDNHSPGKFLTGIPDIRHFSLDEKEKVTNSLFAVKPVLSQCETGELNIVAMIESLLHHPVALISNGQKAENIHFP